MLATSADGRAHDDGTFRLVPTPAAPRRAALLRAAAVPRAADRARAPRRRDRDAEPVRGRARSARAHGSAKVVVEVHGDWRTATRLYGSPFRRALSPLADAVAALGAAAGRRGAHDLAVHVRASSASSASSRPREFATFIDLELLHRDARRCRCRRAPAALFVGVLELYKNVDGLARAWRLAAPRLPGAQLRLVGSRLAARPSSSSSCATSRRRRRGSSDSNQADRGARDRRGDVPRAAVALGGAAGAC